MEGREKAMAARLKKVFSDTSNRQVAKLFGVSEGTVRNYLRGESLPDPDFLHRVAVHFDANAYWLMTGEEIGRQPLAGRVPTAGEKTPQAESGVVRLPLYDVRAAGGAGAVTDDHPELIRHFDFPESWLRQVLGVAPQHARLMLHTGDSMPPFNPGDLLIVDASQTSVSADAIYVFELDGSVFIKKLQRLPRGMLKVISTNPEYDAFTISTTEQGFRVVGRVAFHGKVM